MGTKFLPIFLLLYFASICAKCQVGISETDSVKSEYAYTTEKYAEDLQFLHNKLQDAHPCLYCYTDSTAIQEQLAALTGKLQKQLSHNSDTPITESAFTILVKEYLAVINDGHLDANNHEELFAYIHNKGKFFPLQLLFENGHSYIKSDYSGNLSSTALGAQIVSINGVSIETIAASMYKATSADAGIQIYKTRQLENLERFSIYYWMLYGPQDTYTVSYTLAGKELTATLPGITAKEIIQANEKLAVEPTLTISSDGSLAYMDVNRFEDMAQKPHTFYFWRFLENSFRRLNQQEVKTLIIDLRDNPGGMIYHAHLLLNYISPQNIESAFQIKSSHLLKESKQNSLLSFLQRNFDKKSYASKIAHTPVGRFIPFSSKSHFIANEQLKFKGKVYLLVNGNTFSAAGLFTKYFKEHHLGVVVGEECGASPSFSFGNTLLINLPNTGIQVYVSTAIVSNDTIHEYYNRGIMPDITLQRDITAEANNEDSVLEQVYELIRKDNLQLITSSGE